MNAIKRAQEQVTNQHRLLGRVMRQEMKRLHDHLSAKTNSLHAASPSAILARGYAIVTDTEGKIIKSANQVTVDERLTIQLHTDQINVRVED